LLSPALVTASARSFLCYSFYRFSRFSAWDARFSLVFISCRFLTWNFLLLEFRFCHTSFCCSLFLHQHLHTIYSSRGLSACTWVSLLRFHGGIFTCLEVTIGGDFSHSWEFHSTQTHCFSHRYTGGGSATWDLLCILCLLFCLLSLCSRMPLPGVSAGISWRCLLACTCTATTAIPGIFCWVLSVLTARETGILPLFCILGAPGYSGGGYLRLRCQQTRAPAATTRKRVLIGRAELVAWMQQQRADQRRRLALTRRNISLLRARIARV